MRLKQNNKNVDLNLGIYLDKLNSYWTTKGNYKKLSIDKEIISFFHLFLYFKTIFNRDRIDAFSNSVINKSIGE